MKILSIETSCDDTGIAILEIKGTKKSPTFNVLANVVASQIEVHKKYGGVHPGMAKREHQKNLAPTLTEALKKAGMNKKPNIDLIAVTNGPGLEPCLWVGVSFAKNLSSSWNVPLVPVNHIEAHILVNILDNPNIKFPAIALIVSGGHTQIILVNKIGKYKILGETRDDAAGECFDKCAKLLGLGYPGGPIISQLATEFVGRPTSHRLPRPMFNTKDYDFSFSGLKTAVLYAGKKNQKDLVNLPKVKTLKYKKQMAAEVQQAIIDVLIKKTLKAVKDFGAKSLILGGGVSANQELKRQFKIKLEKELPSTDLFFPKPNLSTDNGLMIAVAGYFHKNKKMLGHKIIADGNLRISK